MRWWFSKTHGREKQVRETTKSPFWGSNRACFEIRAGSNTGCSFFENWRPGTHGYLLRRFCLHCCIYSGLMADKDQLTTKPSQRQKQFFSFLSVFAIFVSGTGRTWLYVQNVLTF
jgi:hypothetical protein